MKFILINILKCLILFGITSNILAQDKTELQIGYYQFLSELNSSNQNSKDSIILKYSKQLKSYLNCHECTNCFDLNILSNIFESKEGSIKKIVSNKLQQCCCFKFKDLSENIRCCQTNLNLLSRIQTLSYLDQLIRVDPNLDVVLEYIDLYVIKPQLLELSELLCTNNLDNPAIFTNFSHDLNSLYLHHIGSKEDTTIIHYVECLFNRHILSPYQFASIYDRNYLFNNGRSFYGIYLSGKESISTLNLNLINQRRLKIGLNKI